MAGDRSPVERAEAALPDRAAHRSRERRATVAQLLAAGDYRAALNLVLSKGIAGEAAKVARTRPDAAAAIYTDVIRTLEVLAAQIPVYKPAAGGERR